MDTSGLRVLLLTQRFHPARSVAAVRWTEVTGRLLALGTEVGVVCRRYPGDGGGTDDRTILELGLADDSGPGSLDGPSSGPGPQGARAAINRLAVPDTAFLRWWSDRRRVMAAARSFGPDVLVSTSPPHGLHLVASSLARRLDVPHIVEFRDPYVGDSRYDTPDRAGWRAANRLAERRIVDRAQAVVALSRRHGADLARRHPASAERIHVVPNGFHPSNPTPARSTTEPGEVHLAVVAAAGRGELETVVRAAPLAWPNRSVVLHAIGLPQAQVEELSAVGPVRVVHHPWVDAHHLGGHLAVADLLVLALDRSNGVGGGTSTKLYQYLGAARPIVAVNPTGTDRDLLDRWGRAAVLDDPTDTEAADALRAALVDDRQPPDLAEFEARFAWSAVAERIGELIAAVAADGRRR